MRRDEEQKLHQLESQFQMSASEILDMILHNNRLRIALKGAVAWVRGAPKV